MNKQQNKVDNPNILIVDDTTRNIQILGTILKNENYNVEFATNGKQALKWIDNKFFDLILLDVMMPEMSGFEVCEIIRKNEELNDIPIIFLTARTDKESIIKGFDIGAQDYVTKPFDTKELLARVGTHLELKQSKEKLKLINIWLEEKVNERTQELKVSNKMLEKANEELLELDNQKVEFLRLISHEIRTPLNGIVGIWDMIRKEAKSEEINSLLDIMEISVTRLEKFAKIALLITELRTKKDVLKMSVENPNSIINVVLNDNKEYFLNKNIQTIIDIPSNDIQIKCDQKLVKICFENIIDNAIQFTPKDSTIHLSVHQNKNYVHCNIKDEGPGFSEKILKNIFKLFTPGHQHIDQNEGLDLAVVKLIMNAHHGKIKLYNAPDKGAIVELLFPNTI